LRNFFFSISLLLIAGMLLAGCKSLQPPMPTESYYKNPVKPQPSVVSLYADLDLDRLAEIVNHNTDSVLYEDSSFVNDNMALKARKNGDIRFSLTDDILSWEIPLRVSIQKTMFMVAFNRPFGDIMETTGEIKLKFKTRFRVNNDWTIHTETTPVDYEWTKKPTMKIAGLTIPVSAIADILLKFNLDNYSKQVDETLASGFNFRKYAEKGWQMLFEPFRIPGGFNAWLSMAPSSIALLPVKATNGKIRFGAVVTSEIECLLDRKPLVAKIPMLPDLKPLEMPGDTFRINLLTDIPYQTIERLTMEEVRDSVFSFGNKRLEFESFRIYGTEGRMAIETTVTGSIKGTMYLTGIPYFNAKDTTLQVKNLKFDLKTRNVWMKSANWLFNGKIERTLTEAIAIPFNSDIRELEHLLSSYLNHQKLGYGFELSGKLSKISVSELILTPESVKTNLVFSGKLSLGIEDTALRK